MKSASDISCEKSNNFDKNCDLVLDEQREAEETIVDLISCKHRSSTSDSRSSPTNSCDFFQSRNSFLFSIFHFKCHFKDFYDYLF